MTLSLEFHSLNAAQGVRDPISKQPASARCRYKTRYVLQLLVQNRYNVASTIAGPASPSRARCHCRWLNQAKALLTRVMTAKMGSRVLMNTLIPTQESKPKGRPKAGNCRKTRCAPHGSDDCAERTSFVGQSGKNLHDENLQ